jgi:hypothetical protein
MLGRLLSVSPRDYPAYAVEGVKRIVIRVRNDVWAPSPPRATVNRAIQVEIKPSQFAGLVAVDDASVRTKFGPVDKNGRSGDVVS